MKRTPLKRKTWIKRGNSSLASYTGFQRTQSIQRKTRLRKKSLGAVPKTKDRIQALLRAIAIKRDGGCVLRNYRIAACGGYTKSGELILQAEHLVTRANSISYADMRNIVCLCAYHHGRWKPQYSRLYWELIEKIIGPERWAWVKTVENDPTPYRFTEYDWQKLEIALAEELKKYD